MSATAEMVKKADDAVNATGYVTEKEIPELHDMAFARELADALTKSREKASEDGYIYTEPFDFVGGKISNIVWNMDKIKTRTDAEATLAADLNWQVVKPSLSEADQKEF
ncbi:hypothetical protein [Lacticaseibacillus sp. N501-2]|uniref:hypothetical protein n=1 Tax=Lacticaseibacillus salsurae TaxID=3367729 RepID=UPI0038B291BC